MKRGRGPKIFGDDPTVRWVVWLCVAVALGAPLLLAAVFAITQ